MKFAALAAAAIFALGACSSSATPAPLAPSAAPGGASASAPASGAATASAPASDGASASTPAAGTIDPCSLLTPADLKTATGKTYEGGVPDGYGQCTWNVGKSGVNNGELVYATTSDQQLGFIKSTFPGGADVTVSGHAGYFNGGQGLGSMWVDIGGRVLVLSFPRSGALTADDQAALQKLAESAVAKIKM